MGAMELLEEMRKKSDKVAKENLVEKEKYKQKMRQIISDYNSGDTELRQKAIGQMIEETDGFIGLIINKHFSTYKKDYYDDLYSCGVIAVIENMQKFDIDKGAVTNYFTYPLIHAMSTFISKNIHHQTAYFGSIIKDIKNAQKFFEEKHIVPSIENLSSYTGHSVKIIEDGLYRMEATNECHYENPQELDSLMKQSVEYTPEKYILEKERNDVLHNTVDSSLAENDKTILFYALGIDPKTWHSLEKKMSWNQISSAMNLPIAVVKNSYNRSIRILHNNPVLKELEGRSCIYRKERVLNSTNIDVDSNQNIINIFNFDDAPIEININVTKAVSEDSKPFIISVN